MRTDKRIKSIADATGKIIDLFESNVIVADIATDHGYIAEKVAEHPKVCEVIATDISEKCLDKTKKLVSFRKLQKITTMLGDGLKPIIRVDVAVISCKGIDMEKGVTDTRDYNAQIKKAFMRSA